MQITHLCGDHLETNIDVNAVAYKTLVVKFRWNEKLHVQLVNIFKTYHGPLVIAWGNDI